MGITDPAIEVFGQKCVECVFETLAIAAVLSKVAIEAGHFGGDAPLEESMVEVMVCQDVFGQPAHLSINREVGCNNGLLGRQ